MEKLITIYVVDSVRGDTKFEFFIYPMTSVKQVVRKLGLEGFSIIARSGRRIPYDADLYAEAEESGPLFLALYNGTARMDEEDYFDD